MSDQATSASAGQTKQSPSSAGASAVVSLGILLSRISGLIRDQVFAHYLGNSPAAGAFRAALRIPNFLQNLFGEGVLSASFIPVYTRLRARGEDQIASQVAGTVASVLALVVSVLVLLGVLFTSAFVDLVAPGFEGNLRALTIQIVRILFPGVGLLVLSAWCLGVLNSHRRFFLSYVAPVFWNLALIGTLVIYGVSGSSQDDLVIKLAWGSVIGSALQLAVQVPFVFGSAGPIQFAIRARLKPAVEIFVNLGPVMLSRGVVQISAYIDSMIASYLGHAAVASLAYAQTIYLLPIGLFGMAVAAAELPAMSEQAGDATTDFSLLRKRVISGRRRIAFFVIPSVIAMVFLGREIIEVLYQSGKFTAEDTQYVWLILIGSVVGLLAATWGRLYSSVFYALKDTRTPLKFALLRVTLTIGLGLLFAFPLRHWISGLILAVPGFRLPHLENIELGMGAVGLTASAGLAGWIEFVLLKRSLEKKIGPSPVATWFLLKAWSAGLLSLLIALPTEGFLRQLFNQSSSTFFSRMLSLATLIFFGLLYFVTSSFFRVDEMNQILARLRRRR